MFRFRIQGGDLQTVTRLGLLSPCSGLFVLWLVFEGMPFATYGLAGLYRKARCARRRSGKGLRLTLGSRVET